MFGFIKELFSGGPLKVLTDIIGGYFTSKQKLKEAELTARLEIMKAKTTATVSLFEQGMAGDIAWENTAISQSGWKDEFWTIILAFPLVTAMIPWTSEATILGFQTFNTLPDWYQLALGIAISASFGFKKFADVMALKNGIDISKVADLQKLTALLPEDAVEKR